MWKITGFLLILAVSSPALSNSRTTTYWFLMDASQRTWCGYSNEQTFKKDVAIHTPTESARVFISQAKVTEITYRRQPESGDWVVVDKYYVTDDGMYLTRVNLLAQENLQVIQKAFVNKKTMTKFNVERVTTLGGNLTSPQKIDYPDVPVMKNISQFPFGGLLVGLKFHSKICTK